MPGHLARSPRTAALMAGELIGAASVLHGIGMWSIPSMFIVGGLAIVIAIEVKQ